MIHAVFDVLGRRDIEESADWSERFNSHQEKLRSGELLRIAEVVRDLSLRERATGLSVGEKKLFGVAHGVLLREVGSELGLSDVEAFDRVHETLQAPAGT